MPNYAIQEQNQDMVSLLSAYFRLLYNPVHAFADAVSMLQMFPGLRGLWPGSAIDGSGNLRDFSGNGLLLTRNGGVSTFPDKGLVPTINYNGTTAYHNRADEAAFDIIGNETYVGGPYQGLTIGSWVFFDNVASATEGISGKWNTAANRSYRIARFSNGAAFFEVSVDGAVATQVFTAGIVGAAAAFVCGRFDPSSELKVWLNGETNTNTTSIPATIFNSSADFVIGGIHGGSQLLDGRIALSFLCAAALPDVFINTFYQMTAPLFGISV